MGRFLGLSETSGCCHWSLHRSRCRHQSDRSSSRRQTVDSGSYSHPRLLAGRPRNRQALLQAPCPPLPGTRQLRGGREVLDQGRLAPQCCGDVHVGQSLGRRPLGGDGLHERKRCGVIVHHTGPAHGGGRSTQDGREAVSQGQGARSGHPDVQEGTEIRPDDSPCRHIPQGPAQGDPPTPCAAVGDGSSHERSRAPLHPSRGVDERREHVPRQRPVGRGYPCCSPQRWQGCIQSRRIRLGDVHRWRSRCQTVGTPRPR
mmetsp:Transcript_22217/g.32434  ORF Transcript_22217/g.32434 Transcript_22217/m.32434 type:complete len:258 (-) Transcript_22217:1846-2619(-)